MAVQEANKYANLTDEQITAVKRRVETFVKDNEFFDKFTNKVSRKHGEKTMRQRRVVKPKVAISDVAASVEDIAPRPQKVEVQTFEHSVDVYRDKVIYTAEDVLYGYDDIVKMAGDTLGDILTQKLDIIKGKPFYNSPAVVTYATSYEATLAKTAIILQKNKVKSWANGRYLAIVTAEQLEAIRTELKADGSYISEPTKADIDSGIIGHYGRWDFTVTDSPLAYAKQASGKQTMVCLGRRPTGEMPIDVASMDGVEIINNPLGSGVLIDADGNYTADDNKQRGSVAMNVNGLGAYINDYLCVINIDTTTSDISLSVNSADITGTNNKIGYVSSSAGIVEDGD